MFKVGDWVNWVNNDGDLQNEKPVPIEAELGEKNGMAYFKLPGSETGISETMLRFATGEMLEGGHYRPVWLTPEIDIQAGARPPGATKPAPKTKKKAGGRGPRLTTPEYIRLYEGWGYDVRLNRCCDDIEVNGTVINDIVRDKVFSQVRDHGIQNRVGTSVAHASEAMSVMGDDNGYHPIRDYLSSLAWDGKDHIKALCSYFVDKDGVFHRWLQHWLVGAVAKVHGQHQNPMLVLDGPQNVGKSYFARWLCSCLPQYFNASGVQPENKDHRLRLLRTWIWEVEELGTTTRKADSEALKAFITLQTVRERKPYGKYETIKDALSSFMGTINDQGGFLVDRSGNRRFLTCTLEAIDWNYTKTDVNQVWAQAMHTFTCGPEHWHLSKRDLEIRDALNLKRATSEPIEVYLDQVLEYTRDEQDRVTTATILNKLAVFNIRPDRNTSMRMSAYLLSEAIGAERCQIGKKRLRGYSGVKLAATLP